MKVRLVLIALLLLVGASLSAQTIERTLDVNALGYTQHDVRPVDTDGNPATEEWLAVPKQAGGLYQVIAISSAGGGCFGTWFNPGAGFYSSATTVGRLGVRDVLLVREYIVFGPGPTLRVVGLTRPPCA
ncbi:MAG: hypothetical protein IT181_13210 [Acidobacteria bacterium]|nr:hypothetical protein [Acidobacteriota bacterium]